MRLVRGKVQIEIDECRHEEGLACAHGKAKQIIGVRDAVEGRGKKLLIINTGRIFSNLILQLFGNLFAAVIGLACVFIERSCGGIPAQKVLHAVRQRELADIQRIKGAGRKQLIQRFAIAGYFQKQVGLDGIHLCVTHLPGLADIVHQSPHGAIVRREPQISFSFDHSVEHKLHP